MGGDAMAAIKEYNGVPLDGQPMSLDSQCAPGLSLCGVQNQNIINRGQLSSVAKGVAAKGKAKAGVVKAKDGGLERIETTRPLLLRPTSMMVSIVISRTNKQFV